MRQQAAIRKQTAGNLTEQTIPSRPSQNQFNADNLSLPPFLGHSGKSSSSTTRANHSSSTPSKKMISSTKMSPVRSPHPLYISAHMLARILDIPLTARHHYHRHRIHREPPRDFQRYPRSLHPLSTTSLGRLHRRRPTAQAVPQSPHRLDQQAVSRDEKQDHSR